MDENEMTASVISRILKIEEMKPYVTSHISFAVSEQNADAWKLIHDAMRDRKPVRFTMQIVDEDKVNLG